ncbi:2',3'-cyclic-nucleotide 3'-phosphodiesterase [Holothuria leucospilota]|uniref:2',3'-cyclic-nucleotide 3'-phosphodiesterase n=1 Tax=Holothuria leucospilota TaxID=206669 RepID=A0A9Q1CGP7_HOLLE|nr:2',3'-cyclic-nucleotide 3'-phosphodiesterase [Holothuria leucospilota]
MFRRGNRLLNLGLPLLTLLRVGLSSPNQRATCPAFSFLSHDFFCQMSHEMEGQVSSKKKNYFPFLNDQPTIDYIKTSRLMMYLPECSDILDSIKHVYPEAKIFSEQSSCSDQTTSAVLNEVKKWLESFSNESAVFAVINDPRLITTEKLKPFGNLSVAFRLVQVYVDQTNFIPLFYGWFFNLPDSEDLRQQGHELLKHLNKEEKFVEEFSKHAIDGPTKGKVDICKYFDTRTLVVGQTLLHCTAFFTNFKQMKETEDYNNHHRQDITRAFKMQIIGFLVTPRTFGVRLKLGDKELQLWHDDIQVAQEVTPQDGNKDEGWKPSKYSPTNGRGSTSHLTLAVREDISAAETGRDLKEIIKREVENQKSGKKVLTLELEIGDARCYGDGLWAIYLNKPQTFTALFSNYYVPEPE